MSDDTNDTRTADPESLVYDFAVAARGQEIGSADEGISTLEDELVAFRLRMEDDEDPEAFERMIVPGSVVLAAAEMVADQREREAVKASSVGKWCWDYPVGSGGPWQGPFGTKEEAVADATRYLATILDDEDLADGFVSISVAQLEEPDWPGVGCIDLQLEQLDEDYSERTGSEDPMFELSNAARGRVIAAVDTAFRRALVEVGAWPPSFMCVSANDQTVNINGAQLAAALEEGARHE